MLMKNEKYFCKRCERYFDDVKIYEERHGFEYPPYEKIAVCPNCEGDDFFKFNLIVDKFDVAEKIMAAIMYLNRFSNSLMNVFGERCANSDLSDSIGLMVELVVEAFDFLDVEMQKRILKMDTNDEMERIITYLKGGL